MGAAVEALGSSDLILASRSGEGESTNFYEDTKTSLAALRPVRPRHMLTRYAAMPSNPTPPAASIPLHSEVGFC
jgi:hypothetical protein